MPKFNFEEVIRYLVYNFSICPFTAGNMLPKLIGICDQL